MRSYHIISHLVISYEIIACRIIWYQVWTPLQYTNITFAIRPISSATNCKLFKIKISLFSVRNFSSFQRLLNLHGFRRSSATARDAYFHPQFLQNHGEICLSGVRQYFSPKNRELNWIWNIFTDRITHWWHKSKSIWIEITQFYSRIPLFSLKIKYSWSYHQEDSNVNTSTNDIIPL